MPAFGGGSVISYQPPDRLQNYRPDSRPNAAEGGARGFPQTVVCARATNGATDAEKAAATIIPGCATFSILPSATLSASGSRSIVAGTFPLFVFIQDESGSEVSPPLLIAGPQVVHLNTLARGLRLVVPSLANTVDAGFDVTIDPDPQSIWTMVNASDIHLLTDFRLSAVAQASGWVNEFVNPGWAHSLVITGRNPNGAAGINVAAIVADSDGTYRSVQDTTALMTLPVNANKLTVAVLWGPGSAVASASIPNATNAIQVAGPAPKKITLTTQTAVDAAKQMTWDATWAR